MHISIYLDLLAVFRKFRVTDAVSIYQFFILKLSILEREEIIELSIEHLKEIYQNIF